MASSSTSAISSSVSSKDQGSIPGFAEYSPTENIHMERWMKSLRKVFEESGFCPFYPRPAERIDQLTKKGGITGQVYTLGRLQNMSMTELALPFDRTVPFALWVNRHAMELIFPYKRYDISYSWRGEHAQKGRFRAFFQADVDVVGKNLSLMADADCISTIWHGLEALGVRDFTMYLNHMDVSRALIRGLRPNESQLDSLLGTVDKIDKLSKEVFTGEIQAQLPDRTGLEINAFYEKIHFKGQLEDFSPDLDEKGKQAYQQLRELFSYLRAYRIDTSRLQFCPSMVRGLNYYTGVVFETFLNKMPQYGSIASGGRYDELVEKVSDETSTKAKNLEGVGGSIGVTRLFELLKDELPAISATTAEVLVGYRDDKQKAPVFKERALNVVSTLRSQGVKADIQYSPQKMKELLSLAAKLGYLRVFLIMDDANVVVRNLSTSSQIELHNDSAAVDALIQGLRSLTLGSIAQTSGAIGK